MTVPADEGMSGVGAADSPLRCQATDGLTHELRDATYRRAAPREPCRLPEPEKGQYGDNDNDCADEIDNVVHGGAPPIRTP
jgi:hypothetical protein